jgi:hypothetical protein
MQLHALLNIQNLAGVPSISIGVYFSDPDGNGLEVYYELPRSQWNQDKPFSIQNKGRFPGPWDEELKEAASAGARA